MQVHMRCAEKDCEHVSQNRTMCKFIYELHQKGERSMIPHAMTVDAVDAYGDHHDPTCFYRNTLQMVGMCRFICAAQKRTANICRRIGMIAQHVCVQCS